MMVSGLRGTMLVPLATAMALLGACHPHENRTSLEFLKKNGCITRFGEINVLSGDARCIKFFDIVTVSGYYVSDFETSVLETAATLKEVEAARVKDAIRVQSDEKLSKRLPHDGIFKCTFTGHVTTKGGGYEGASFYGRDMVVVDIVSCSPAL